jgi:hypothetical protein
MSLRGQLCLVALSLVAAGTRAQATEKPLYAFGAVVNGVGGAGTPVGLVGVEGRLDFASWLFLSAGAGLNPSPQLAAMGHLRVPLPTAIPSQQVAITAGYGRSRGKHTWRDLSNINFDQESDYASNKEGMLWWHNFQIDVEVRFRQRALPVMVIGGFGGLAVAGNPQDIHCVGPGSQECESLHRDSGFGPIPYFGLFAGFAFL